MITWVSNLFGKPGSLRGIVAMLVATLCYSLMHTMIRYVSETMHPFEIAFFRNVFGLIVILPWFYRLGFGVLRTRRIGMHTIRAAVNVLCMLWFFYALSNTPLSEVTAHAFTAPLFATLLSTLLLGEKVGWGRWVAITVGFIGALVVLRPGFTVISTGHWLVLASALTWGGVLIIIKSLGKTESSVTITAYMSILMAPMTLVAAVFVWTWPTWTEIGWLVAIGITGSLGQMLTAQALKEADTAVVTPFDFFRLIWITGMAYVIFAEIPGLHAWVGGLVIFASGAYLANAERLRANRARTGKT